jgi:hypothetical protein
MRTALMMVAELTTDPLGIEVWYWTTVPVAVPEIP